MSRSATSILGHTINGTSVPVEGRLPPFLGSLKDIQGLLHLPRTQLALPTVHDEGMREIGINKLILLCNSIEDFLKTSQSAKFKFRQYSRYILLTPTRMALYRCCV